MSDDGVWVTCCATDCETEACAKTTGDEQIIRYYTENDQEIGMFALPSERKERCEVLKRIKRCDLLLKKNLAGYYVCQTHFIKNEKLSSNLDIPSLNKFDNCYKILNSIKIDCKNDISLKHEIYIEPFDPDTKLQFSNHYDTDVMEVDEKTMAYSSIKIEDNSIEDKPSKDRLAVTEEVQANIVHKVKQEKDLFNDNQENVGDNSNKGDIFQENTINTFKIEEPLHLEEGSKTRFAALENCVTFQTSATPSNCDINKLFHMISSNNMAANLKQETEYLSDSDTSHSHFHNEEIDTKEDRAIINNPIKTEENTFLSKHEKDESLESANQTLAYSSKIFDLNNDDTNGENTTHSKQANRSEYLKSAVEPNISGRTIKFKEDILENDTLAYSYIEVNEDACSSTQCKEEGKRCIANNSIDELKSESMVCNPSCSTISSAKEILFSVKNKKHARVTTNNLIKLLCEQTLQPEMANIVKLQLRSKKLGSFTKRDKRKYLKLYHKSPTGYLMFKDLLSLPSLKEIKRFFVTNTTNTNDFLKTFISIVDRMSHDQKQCSVCIEIVELKSTKSNEKYRNSLIGCHKVEESLPLLPAKYAVIAMARGILSDWKQLLSFSFVASINIKVIVVWIQDNMITCFKMGLRPRVIVSDIIDIDILSNTTEEKILIKSLEVMNVHLIFDVPKLMKDLRNQWMCHDFHQRDTIYKWEDVKQLYEIEKAYKIKLAPNLTNAHINPNVNQRKVLKYAVHVLSNSVSKAMWFYCEHGVLHRTALQTADFISRINLIFDVLNKKSPDIQERDLISSFNFLVNLQVIDRNGKNVTSKMKFLTRLIRTFRSFIILNGILESDGLLSRRLNLNCIKVLVKKAEKLNNCKQLSTKQAYSAFSTKIFSNIFKFSNQNTKGNELKMFLHSMSSLLKEIEDVI